MDIFGGLELGFAVALSLDNLSYALIGCLLGTFIGVLPGLGPVPTIALLLPLTFRLDPIGSLIMLAGIYYGAQYGGSTTAILVNLPGESSSVVTTLDGYKMARKGRAGAALGIAALGSLFAGCVGTLLIAVAAGPLTALALKFGPHEYFALMLLGLVAATVLASGSVVKSIAMVVLGLLLALVGTDVTSGQQRFTFGIPELSDGLSFVPVAMGLFGIAEILRNLEAPEQRAVLSQKITRLLPSRAELAYAAPAVGRGTVIGSILGILPGGGAVLSAFAAYMVEKKVTRSADEPLGTGNIRGVAAPESANNAGAQTSFIPMLTLGIPGNPVMALMISAMIIQGIVPGPQVMTSKPDLFWGMIASMFIGNVMLVVINLPLIGLWVNLLKVPYRIMFPAILMFCCVGVYSLQGSAFDIVLMAVFGVVGYLLMKLEFEPAPLILAFVLGSQMEEYLRRAMTLSGGDFTSFAAHPIALGLIIVAALLLTIVLLPSINAKRAEAFKE